MAERPMASALLLLHPPVEGIEALAVAATIEAGHVPPTPVCVQTLKSVYSLVL